MKTRSPIRWPRIVFVLCAVLAAAIFVVRALGGREPSPLMLLFANPDGTPCQMPCLFGVRPGQMSRTQTMVILRAHPLTSRLERLDVDTRPAPAEFYADGILIRLLENEAGTVEAVLVYLFPQHGQRGLSPGQSAIPQRIMLATPAPPLDSLSFGTIGEFLGPPSRVTTGLVYSGSQATSVYYTLIDDLNRVTVAGWSGRMDLLPTDRVEYLEVSTGFQSLSFAFGLPAPTGAQLSTLTRISGWQGFASVWRYFPEMR